MSYDSMQMMKEVLAEERGEGGSPRALIAELLREDVSSRRASNLHSVWRVAFILVGICFSLWVGGVGSPPLSAAAFLSIGLLQYHLIVVLHEAFHAGLFHPHWLNDAVGYAVAGALTFDFRGLRRSHLEHHRTYGFNGDPDLPDYELRPSYRNGFVLPLEILLRPVVRLFDRRANAVQTAVPPFPQERSGLDPAARAALLAARSRRPAYPLTFLGAQAVLFFLSWQLAGDWWAYGVFWVAPMVLIPGVLARLRTLGEHVGLVEAAWGRDRQFLYARSNVAGGSGWSGLVSHVEKFVLSPFHFNYHHEHHLVPQVPYHSLPRVHACLREKGHYDRHPEVLGRNYLTTIATALRNYQDTWKSEALRTASAEKLALYEDSSCLACDAPIPLQPIGIVQEHEYSDTTQVPFPVMKCGECGLVFLWPRPSEEEIPRIYPADYYAYHLTRIDAERAERVPSRVERILDVRARRALEKRLAAAGLTAEAARERGRPLRVLDVGCGTGRHLDMVKELLPGCETHGVDLGEEAVSATRKRGHNAHIGRFEEVNLPRGSFDFILSLHVIEHVARPDLFLARCRELLAPGGKLLIETPNTDCPEFHWFQRRWWGGYHPPRHWYLFDRGSLQRMAEKQGFRDRGCDYYTNAFFWAWTGHSILNDFSPLLADALFPPVKVYFGGLRSVALLGTLSLLEQGLHRSTGKASSLWMIFEHGEPGSN